MVAGKGRLNIASPWMRCCIANQASRKSTRSEIASYCLRPARVQNRSATSQHAGRKNGVAKQLRDASHGEDCLSLGLHHDKDEGNFAVP